MKDETYQRPDLYNLLTIDRDLWSATHPKKLAPEHTKRKKDSIIKKHIYALEKTLEIGDDGTFVNHIFARLSRDIDITNIGRKGSDSVHIIKKRFDIKGDDIIRAMYRAHRDNNNLVSITTHKAKRQFYFKTILVPYEGKYIKLSVSRPCYVGFALDSIIDFELEGNYESVSGHEMQMVNYHLGKLHYITNSKPAKVI